MQIDSGATDAAGTKEIAKALEMKETEMSRSGIGQIAAKWSSIKNYGEEKIVGCTDDGESVSARAQRADVERRCAQLMS